MAEVPLAIFTREPARVNVALLTDDDGMARWRVDLPEAPVECKVILAQPLPNRGQSVKQFDRRKAAFEQLLRRYTFERYYTAIISPEHATARIEIVVTEAISVRAMLTADGVPAGGRDLWVWGRFAATKVPTVEPDGTVVVGGIRPGEATELYFYLQGVVRRIVIPGSEADVMLGAIDLTYPPKTGVLRLENKNGAQCDRFLERAFGGATLVSLETGDAISLPAGTVDPPLRDPLGVLPRVPAGEYLVAPFMFSGRPAQIALIRRVLSGEDLSGSGLPRVVVPDGGVGEVVIDAVATEAAILGGVPGG